MTTVEQLAIFRSCFSGLTEVYGTYDLQFRRARQVKRAVTNRVLVDHLQGRQPYGVYLLTADRTRAMAFDFDTPDLAPVLAIVEVAWHRGIPTYIERSKSKGHHLWIFFEKSGVLAAKARRVALGMLTEIGRLDVEVFPKQDRLDGHTRYGNFIVAPLFGGAVAEQRTVFVQPEDATQPYPDQWTLLSRVSRVPEAHLDQLLVVDAAAATVTGDTRGSRGLDGSEMATAGLPPCAQRMLAQGVCRHQRVSCFRLAVQLKKTGLPYDLAVATLNAWSQRNRPMGTKRVITRDEIQAQAADAYRGSYRSCGCEDPAVVAFCHSSCTVRRTNGPSDTTQTTPAPPVDSAATHGEETPHKTRNPRTNDSPQPPCHRRSIMSEQAPQRPVKEFRAGGIRASIWQNEVEQDGRRLTRSSVRITKRYFDAQDGQWKDSDSLFVNDLPRVGLVTQRAFEYLVLAGGDVGNQAQSQD